MNRFLALGVALLLATALSGCAAIGQMKESIDPWSHEDACAYVAQHSFLVSETLANESFNLAYTDWVQAIRNVTKFQDEFNPSLDDLFDNYIDAAVVTVRELLHPPRPYPDELLPLVDAIEAESYSQMGQIFYIAQARTGSDLVDRAEIFTSSISSTNSIYPRFLVECIHN